MNYSVVVVGIVGIVSTAMWFISGSKNFKGPQVDIAALSEMAASEDYEGERNGPSGAEKNAVVVA